jgi:TonB family protein
MELPPPPDDEEWFTNPEFNTDSLYGRIIYPEPLRKIDFEGRVIVQVLVDTNGRASKTRIIESVKSLLNQPVIDAVKQTHFTPAYRLDNHRPVAVWITIPIDFTISAGRSYN